MFRRSCLPLTVLVLIVLSLDSCSRKSAPVETIRIGIIATIRPPIQTSDSTELLQAAQLAVKKVNDAGGLTVAGQKQKVELIMESSAVGEEEAVAAAYRLINQQHVVAIVVLGATHGALPIAEVAERAMIPMISTGSTSPATTAGKRFIFRIQFTDELQAEAMAKFAKTQLKLNRIAVLFEASDPYSNGIASIFARDFEKLGGRIVASESYTHDAGHDFKVQLDRIKKSGAMAFYLPNRPGDSSRQVMQAVALGIKPIVLGSDVWGVPPFSAELEGGFYTTSYSVTSPTSSEFSQEYLQAYARMPVSDAFPTYDALNLIFRAIEFHQRTDGESIRKSLSEIEPFQGTTGVIKYRGSGDPLRSVAIMRITNGKPEISQVVNPE